MEPNRVRKRCKKRKHNPNANAEKNSPSSTKQNDFNTSNPVLPQKILRLKLHSSFPILFLPEYVSRRLASLKDSENSENMFLEDFEWPQQLRVCYQSFLDTQKYKERSKHRRSSAASIERSTQDKNDINEQLVRMIVIPLHANLISKVAYPSNQNIRESSNDGEKESKTNESNKSEEKTEEKTSAIAGSSKPFNCYLKAKTKRKFNQVNQSLNNLTDGLISLLVHQKKRFSRKIPLKENPEYIHQCRGVNVLSEGYKVATDRQMHNFGPPGKRRRVRRNTNVVGSNSSVASHCTNMQPGIQCTQPNSCASFARSSPVMKMLHGLIGDDLMRELMLRCMILVPIFDHDSANIDRGNYFQLSGPPLSMMNKNFRPEGFDTSTLADDTQPLKISPFWAIPRYRMFYSDSYTPHVGLPSKHILNSGNPFSDAPENVKLKLLLSMVDIMKPSGYKSTKRWKRVRERGLDICNGIIKGHKKCDYHRLLERYCPLPRPNRTKDDEATLELLISRHSDKKKVVSFFKSVVSKVFPKDFWGSCHNLNVALGGMELFLTMRKNEKMPMKQIMKGIRIKDVQWLYRASRNKSRRKHPRTDHEAAIELMKSVMQWVYCNFLIPLVRSTFYCTDTEFTGDQLMYFRKPLWSQIRNLAMKHFSRQFQPVRANDIASVLQASSFPCSSLRLLPKVKGIRPIALLCKPDERISKYDGAQKSSWERRLSTNKSLCKVFDVLSHEHSQKPKRFGAGLHGLHDLHGKLLDYLQKLKKPASEFFFVSVDIKHCYDNINQQYLLELMDRIITKEEYAIQEHTILHLTNSASKVKHQQKKSIGATGDIVNFLEINKTYAKDQRNAVFLDKVRCEVASKTDLLHQIQEHLLKNLLVMKDEIGSKLYIQKIGIPQGSVLSSLLCNFYYGDIEESLLDGVFEGDTREQNLLVRIIDDFLLITTDENIAKRFLRKLVTGSESLGVQINKTKTKTSHDLDVFSISQKPHILKMNQQTFFPWCGFAFNTKSCEVQIDYGRFSQSRASETLRICRIKNEGTNFASKLKDFVKPRCANVLFDSRINKQRTIRLNFYQVIMLCAVKSFHYVASGLNGGISQNEAFIEKSIFDIILFARNLIHSKLSKKTANDSNDVNGDTFERHPLRETEALFLGLHAFEAAFRYTANDDFVKMANTMALCRNQLHLPPVCINSLSEAASNALASFDLDRFDL